MDIVFVHLNSKIPRYLYWNLLSHIHKFPQHKIVLIHSAGVEIPHIKGLTLVSAIEDSRWLELDQLYDHPKDFRNNFWLTASARLFALENYLKHSNKQILHVESDVILSRDFPFEVMAKIQEGLGYPVISQSRGAASVVYVRDVESAAILTSSLIKDAQNNPQTTEMLSLKQVYEMNPGKVCALPVGTGGFSSYRNIDEVEFSKQVQNSRIFGGVIDGVEIGQYFCGTDPRNRRGIKLLRNDLVNGYVEVNNLLIEFDPQRDFCNVIEKYSGEKYPLFALHVPSKEIRAFKINRQSRWLRQLARDSDKGPQRNLSLLTLCDSIWRSLGRKIKRFLQERVRAI